MEFQKERVFTALNADELKPGSKVICANCLANLKEYVADYFNGCWYGDSELEDWEKVE